MKAVISSKKVKKIFIKKIRSHSRTKHRFQERYPKNSTEKETGNQSNKTNYWARCWLLGEGYFFPVTDKHLYTYMWFLVTSAVRIVNEVFAVTDLGKHFLLCRAVILIAMFRTAHHWFWWTQSAPKQYSTILHHFVFTYSSTTKFSVPEK